MWNTDYWSNMQCIRPARGWHFVIAVRHIAILMLEFERGDHGHRQPRRSSRGFFAQALFATVCGMDSCAVTFTCIAFDQQRRRCAEIAPNSPAYLHYQMYFGHSISTRRFFWHFGFMQIRLLAFDIPHALAQHIADEL